MCECSCWTSYRTFRFGTQYPPVPSSPPPLPQLQPHWYSQVAISRDQDYDIWVLPPVFLVLINVPGSPPIGCTSQGGRLEMSTSSPQFPLKGVLVHSQAPCPNPYIKNIWSHCSNIPHNCVNCCLDPWHYVDFYYHSLHLLTVNRYWLQFSVAPALPLTAVQFALTLAMPSFPSNWAYLTQTPSPGQSSYSDSALQTTVMSWVYIFCEGHQGVLFMQLLYCH